MTRFLSALMVCLIMGAASSASSASSSSASAAELVPTGTLRAAFISTNPVQAVTDPKTGEVRGPAAELTRELARRLGVPGKIEGARGVPGVLAAVKNGEADIGFLAYDPPRAAEVDYSQTYSLAQNTFMVLDASPLKSVADIDRPGIRIGTTQGNTGDLYLTRTLKHVEFKRSKDGNMDMAMAMLRAREIDAYGTNRQRLFELAAANPGFRLLPDNFYGVPQAIIVKKGNKPLLQVVERMLDEARSSGLIAGAIKRAGLVGVDVAPPAPPRTR